MKIKTLLENIINFNPKSLYDSEGTLIPLEHLPTKVLMCLEIATETSRKPYSKTKAIELLLKMDSVENPVDVKPIDLKIMFVSKKDE